MGTMARLCQNSSISRNASDAGIGAHHSIEYSHIGARGHGNLVTRVENGGEFGQDLGHGSCEHHVPCGEEQGCKIEVSRDATVLEFSSRLSSDWELTVV